MVWTLGPAQLGAEDTAYHTRPSRWRTNTRYLDASGRPMILTSEIVYPVQQGGIKLRLVASKAKQGTGYMRASSEWEGVGQRDVHHPSRLTMAMMSFRAEISSSDTILSRL